MMYVCIQFLHIAWFLDSRASILVYLDIDECEEGADECDHNCTNTDGSYYCTCMDGYELESDNHTCKGEIHLHKLIMHT